MKRIGKITVQLDGNMWCATREGFTNLQESLSGFGRTEIEAVEDLIKDENTKDCIHLWSDNQELIQKYENQIG